MKNDFLKEKILRWFSNWAMLKPKLHFSDNREVFPKRREIWWASVGQNIGVEVNGKNSKFERPILIVKVFNADFVLAVSISSQEKEGKYYYAFKNPDGKKNVVVLSQIKSISSKRLVRKIGEIEATDFSKIVARLKDMI
ncbi:MAG: type II toxin-antitoxin system PemK/MazF family toxin [Patescibacteria group bacterium]